MKITVDEARKISEEYNSNVKYLKNKQIADEIFKIIRESAEKGELYVTFKYNKFEHMAYILEYFNSIGYAAFLNKDNKICISWR